MSNDKVAATVSGSDPALARTIEAAEIRGFACGVAAGGYHERPTREDWNAARRWATNYGYRSQTETTGEHTEAKLADNLYGGVTGEQALWSARLAAAVPGPHAKTNQERSFNPAAAETSDERYANQYLRDMAQEPVAAPVRRGWTPTAGEIALALGIVGFIVFIFCFLVIAY